MNRIATLAIAGLATAATAQSVTLHFDLDSNPGDAAVVEAGVGDVLSWTVWASFTGFDNGAYFGGFVGAFNANNPGAAAVSNIAVLLAGSATTPMANGGNVENINMFNSALLGTDDSSNPIAIMTFDTEVLSAEGFNYFTDGTTSVFPDGGIFTLPTEFNSVSIISDSVVVPAPGAAAVLGLGGLVAVRRRR